MQKSTGILQLTITVLLVTIKASDSSNLTYISCYECKYNYTTSSDSSNLCYNPSSNSDKVPTCVGRRCKQTISTCTGSDEQCGGTSMTNVNRHCINETDGQPENCNAISLPPDHFRKISDCVCMTDRCNGGGKSSKSASSAKFVNSVVLETTVFALCFVSATIYK